jgi:hypothetical protein
MRSNGADKAIIGAVSLLLMVSMGLHAVHLSHHHPEHFGQDAAAAALHGEDRKLLIAVSPAPPAPISIIVVAIGDAVTFGTLDRVGRGPLFIALSRGIVHRKICG